MLGILRVLMAGNALRAASRVPKIASSMVIIIIMGIVIGIMTSALIIGLFYMLYSVLLHYAFTQLIAALITLGAMVVIIGICVTILCCYMRRVQHGSREVAAQGAPLASQVSDVVKAFVDGLSTPPK